MDRIRGAINTWEKHGYVLVDKTWQDRVVATATGIYQKKPWKRKTRRGHAPALKNVLWGKLLYLRMVRGENDLIYIRLAERYNAAVTMATLGVAFSAPTLPVEPVVRDSETALDACLVESGLSCCPHRIKVVASASQRDRKLADPVCDFNEPFATLMIHLRL